MERLCEIKDQLVRNIENVIADGLSGVDAHELGAAVDMVKDLSEAIYYCSVTEAMKEVPHQDMMGYNPNRSETTGRYVSGRSSRGYNTRNMGYGGSSSGGSSSTGSAGYHDPGNGSMGYPENNMGYPTVYMHGENARMGYTEQTPQRYGRAYNDYQVARRHYTATKSQDDKESMNKHANEHLSDTMTTIREIWDAAEPEQRKRIKNDLSTLVGEMNT